MEGIPYRNSLPLIPGTEFFGVKSIYVLHLFLSVLLVQMPPALLQGRPPEIFTGRRVTSHPSLPDSLHFTDAGLTSRVFVKCRDKDHEVFQQGYRLTISLVEAEGRRPFPCFFYLAVVGWK